MRVPSDLVLRRRWYLPAHEQTGACIWFFIPALLMIVKDYKKAKHSKQKGDWLKKFLVELGSAVKRNEEVLHKIIGTDLPDVFLKERGKVWNAVNYMLFV